MTKEFIIKSLLPYKENPHLCGYENGWCMYLTSDGKKCSIGQYMKKGKWQSLYNVRVDKLLTGNKVKKYMKAIWCKQNVPNVVALYMQKYHDCIANDNKYNINVIVGCLENNTGYNLNELKI
jgi:hypothetical protein